ncbi:MAG: CBS domain-containing protein [Spirochaetales bacterium]|nr:CBS domain-containing protein [Spirochaetales bacterium]
MELVKDVISAKGNEVWSVIPESSVELSLGVLANKNIGALPVLNSNGDLVGIFSERDYTRACAKSNTLCLECPVSEVMTTRVFCVNPKQTIDNCMALMTDKRIRHLPVIDGTNLVGIISIGDVVKAVINEKDILIDQLEHYIEGSL